MAEVYILEGDDRKEQRTIEGELRILRFSMEDDDESDAQLFFQPHPNSENREVGLRVRVDELKHFFEAWFSFDNSIASYHRMEKDGSLAKTGSELQAIGKTDVFSMMKHSRREAAAFAKLFRGIADQLDHEVTQYDLWIEQEEQDRKVEFPDFMKIPNDLDD